MSQKLSIKDIQRKGEEYCKKHCHDCEKCPLRNHTMCINTCGNLCLNTYTIDFVNFGLDLKILLEEIGACL